MKRVGILPLEKTASDRQRNAYVGRCSHARRRVHITPPSRPVDFVYKINRITGKVWLVRPCSKPLAHGQGGIFVAREAEAEKTRPLTVENFQTFAMEQRSQPGTNSARRR